MTTHTDFSHLYGRLLTSQQLTESERHLATPVSSQTADGACFRCATPFEDQHRLPNGAFYCRACILLGRIRSDQSLYTFPQKEFPPQTSLAWTGTLSPWQQEVSDTLVQQVANRLPTLVHAVTGAGKTEMVYQTLAATIDCGGAVCLASPRVDVCIELFNRLRRDFSCPISLLHGESDPYVRSPLVIATTHQLLRFYQAFDLLLIDEVDAFPYVDNPVLYHAAKQAVKPNGVTVFLTATSTPQLDRKIREGSLHRLSLPRRFHGNPLVVPKKVWCTGLEKQLAKKRLPLPVKRALLQQRQAGHPLLLFAPEIQMGERLAQVLAKYFPNENIGFVSSQTSNRLDLVEAFRKNEISILVSTTILERGVTFPGVDVFVLDAHHRLYTSSSLIQIAGRVGRSSERPTGELLFFQEGSTQAIEQAIYTIKTMNKEAGYDHLSTL